MSGTAGKPSELSESERATDGLRGRQAGGRCPVIALPLRSPQRGPAEMHGSATVPSSLPSRFELNTLTSHVTK